MHLHGQHFYIVKAGYPDFDLKTGLVNASNSDIGCGALSSCGDSKNWARETWTKTGVPGLNLHNPPFKVSFG